MMTGTTRSPGPALRAVLLATLAVLALAPSAGAQAAPAGGRRPNILFAISDDQSFPHTSAYGARFVNTPAFDRVAREGVLFRNAYVASPGCSPSRAAFLTGRHVWQIEEAGTHASSFPAKYVVFPDLLEGGGYFVGMTGKGWGPGNWEASGRKRNPAGPVFARAKIKPPFEKMSDNDYAANFEEFLRARPAGQPFYFWYGAQEPHREYEPGIGLRRGKRLEDVTVPGFLPDTREIRSDLLDYAVEIEWADAHLGRMLQALERTGELENTIVIVTADNGMAFPRAKASTYDAGIHVPLAIRWGSRVPGGRTVDDLVGLVDLTPTLLEAAGVRHPGTHPMSGHSVMDLLTSGRSGTVRATQRAVFSGRERHSSSRWNNLSYSQRAMREGRYLYIRNFTPDRWPAGDPQSLGDDGKLGPMHGAYHDIDASPTLSALVEYYKDRSRPELARFLGLAVDKRPTEELFDLESDPHCLRNLAADPAHSKTRARLAARLEGYLRETGDPRVLGNGEVFEAYPRYSPIRKFPAHGEPERRAPATVHP